MSASADKHSEAKRWIKGNCTKLRAEDVDWENASDPKRYNCFGFAVGILKWWQHWDRDRHGRIKNSYDHWKSGLPNNDSIEAYVAAAKSEGFSECDQGWESGYEKIVLYFILDGDNRKFTHASRQTAADRWKSKIGKESDFEHPEEIGCIWYGNGRVYMRRPRIISVDQPVS